MNGANRRPLDRANCRRDVDFIGQDLLLCQAISFFPGHQDIVEYGFAVGRGFGGVLGDWPVTDAFANNCFGFAAQYDPPG